MFRVVLPEVPQFFKRSLGSKLSTQHTFDFNVPIRKLKGREYSD